MKMIEGDLIQLAKDGRFDVVIHGCNCFCNMGAGIAAHIRKHFPEAFEADLNTPMGERQKLGTFSSAKVKRGGKIFTIINGYTQFHYSGAGPLVDYGAVGQIFMTLKNDFSGLTFGYPKIGAGLAKGNWDKLSRIIDNALDNEDHSLVVYKSKG